MSKPDEQPKAVRIDSWEFEGSFGRRGGGVSLAGIFLIVIGLLLAAGMLFREAQIGASAVFLAVGVCLVIMGVRDRSDLALYTGVFVSALALSNLLSGAEIIHGQGWGTLFLGLGVTAIALTRTVASRRWGWALGVGALLTLWGGSEVVAANTSFAADRLVGPVLIVLLGIYIVSRTRRGRGY